MWDIPIPYFGMILSLLIAPSLTFGFILLLKKQKNSVEKLRIQKEILELEIKRDELRLEALSLENKKYDLMIGEGKFNND